MVLMLLPQSGPMPLGEVEAGPILNGPMGGTPKTPSEAARASVSRNRTSRRRGTDGGVSAGVHAGTGHDAVVTGGVEMPPVVEPGSRSFRTSQSDLMKR